MRVLTIVLLIAFWLAGCSIYRLDVQQGNIVEADQLEKLKVGMDKNQVRFLLGTPLITDPFHANRWDYVYSRRHEGSAPELQRVTVFFENDAVSRIDHTLTNTPTATP
jgi:outer membrane protein assembly factor BamE